MSDWIEEPWTVIQVRRYIREGCFKDAEQLCIFLKQSLHDARSSLNEWRGRAQRSSQAVSQLRATAEQLNKWADESQRGGWSTHQVEPMRKHAAYLYELIGRLTEP